MKNLTAAVLAVALPFAAQAEGKSSVSITWL